MLWAGTTETANNLLPAFQASCAAAFVPERLHARCIDHSAAEPSQSDVLKTSVGSITIDESEAESTELAHEVDTLVRSRDTSREDYEAGAIALTDVLDADRELLAAQDRLALSRTNAARAAVATFRAFGGGW